MRRHAEDVGRRPARGGRRAAAGPARSRAGAPGGPPRPPRSPRARASTSRRRGRRRVGPAPRRRRGSRPGRGRASRSPPAVGATCRLGFAGGPRGSSTGRRPGRDRMPGPWPPRGRARRRAAARRSWRPARAGGPDEAQPARMGIRGDDATAVRHQRRQVRRLRARRRADIGDRLAGERPERVPYHDGRLVLHRDAPVPKRRELAQVSGPLEQEPLEGESRGRHAGARAPERLGRRRRGRAQRVGPDAERRHRAHRQGEGLRLVGPVAGPPASDEPRRLGGVERQGLDRVVGRGHGPRARLGRERPEDAVQIGGGAGRPPALGQLHCLVDRGPWRDPVQEPELIRREPEERPDPGRQLVERPSRHARERPVKAPLPTEGPQDELRHEGAIPRVEPGPIGERLQQPVGVRGPRLDPQEDLEGDGARRGPASGPGPRARAGRGRRGDGFSGAGPARQAALRGLAASPSGRRPRPSPGGSRAGPRRGGEGPRRSRSRAALPTR